MCPHETRDLGSRLVLDRVVGNDNLDGNIALLNLVTREPNSGEATEAEFVHYLESAIRDFVADIDGTVSTLAIFLQIFGRDIGVSVSKRLRSVESIFVAFDKQ